VYGARFDDILFYGPEADAGFLLASGYVSEFRQGWLMIAHFRGCTGTLRIAGAPDAGTVFVATGWGAYDRHGWFAKLPSRPNMEVVLQRVPCGDAWVRVVAPEAGKLCEEADGGGTIRTQYPRQTPIECRMRSR